MPQGRYVGTKQQLAARLGIRYGTSCHYFQSPGHPPNHSQGDLRYEVEAWQQWLQERRFKRAGITAFDPTEREKSIIAKNRIVAAREQFDLDVKRGNYVSRLEANRAIDTGNAIVRREMEKLMKYVMPCKVQGLSPGQVSKLGMTELNKVLRFLPGHFQAAASDNGSSKFQPAAAGGGAYDA